jgi:hypothetical protein
MTDLAATRGTEMTFADVGVNPTPWGYSPCGDIIKKLISRDIRRRSWSS